MDYKAIAQVLALALGAIDQAIDTFRKRQTQDQTIKYATDALQAISAIVEHVHAGDISKIDPEAARKDLAMLISALEQNDRAADAALADKFDTSDVDV
jgi:hypothetical protein